MNLAEFQYGQEKTISFQYVVCSEVNERENNEDSFHIYDLPLPSCRQALKILSIADGMGGHAWGEHVSSEALRKVSLVLFEQLCATPSINSLEAEKAIEHEKMALALKSAVEQANAFVQRMVRSNNWGKAGSTIAIVAILDNTAVVVNLGDSPVFHYQKSTGKVRKVTDDHTVTGSLLRQGKITPEMALHHEGRSVLKWYVGVEKLPSKMPTRYIELAAEDLLLLCTDGVTGLLPEKEVEAILSNSNSDLKKIAQCLIETAREHGETDNQTLILWRHGVSVDIYQEEKVQEKIFVGKVDAIEEKFVLLDERLKVIEGKVNDEKQQEDVEERRAELEERRAEIEEWVEVVIKEDIIRAELAFDHHDRAENEEVSAKNTDIELVSDEDMNKEKNGEVEEEKEKIEVKDESKGKQSRRLFFLKRDKTHS